MKRIAFRIHLLVIALMFVALAGLLVNVQSFDPDRLETVHRLLGAMGRADTLTRLDMLKIYTHRIPDFDSLASEMKHLSAAHRQLIKALPEEAFGEELRMLARSIRIQRRSVNQFESAFSTLSNSIRYLPTLSARLIEQRPKLEIQLVKLTKDIFYWQVFPDNRMALDRIQKQMKAIQSLGLDKLHHHIRIIMAYGQKAIGAIDLATASGIPENINRISKTYDRYFALKVKKNHENRLMLVALGAFMLLYVLILLISRHEDAVRLADSEKRFRLLFDLIPDGVGLHCDGKWIYCNPAAVRLFGADSPGDIIGTPVLDRVCPDLRPKIAQRIARETDQGHEAPLMLQKNLRMDGSEFYGEVQGIPFSDGDGAPVLMTVMRDVTGRIQAETRTRRLAAAVEHTAEAIMISDHEARIEYVNPAFEKMTGYTLAEVAGELEGLLRSGCHNQEFFRGICDTVESNRIWTGEVIIRDKHGKLMTTERSVSPVITAGGKVSDHITVMRDVTEEKEMQEKMEHVQRLESLGVLAGGIAHDFNNILTAIMGNAALGKMKLEDTSPALAHLARIEKSSQRAAELCKQMLAYSGKGRFVVKAINLSDMVEDITKLLDVSIAKNVVLKFHLAENLPPVEADGAQLQQVIMNLVINASDAIGRKSGVISLSTGMMQADADYLGGAYAADGIEPGRFVFLEVADTGCGMDERTQKKLFDPFFTTKFTGRGLGMSAVLGIVRGHHGAIKVYSEEGQGTTFKVLLPASKEAVSDHTRQTARGEWCGAGTVLIVDDEETIRETAAMMLRDMGFDTISAEDGEQGVDIYRKCQNEIVAVLLDMTMPKLDGKGCFREIRRINKDVRVVLSSGYNEQDATNRFAGQGLAGFIQKPYTPGDLRAKMKEALGENT